MRLDSSDTVWVDWYQLPLCSHELASCGSVTVCAVSLGVFPWPGGAQLGSCCWEILDGCQGAWLCVPEAPCLQSLQEKHCEGARTRGRFAVVEVVDFPPGAGEVAVLHGQAALKGERWLCSVSCAEGLAASSPLASRRAQLGQGWNEA